ncbi:hypothetical protein A2U01_0064156, partial [Trifolium medium]|nr:hypothetical protein [Trifolium medium]
KAAHKANEVVGLEASSGISGVVGLINPTNVDDDHVLVGNNADIGDPAPR